MCSLLKQLKAHILSISKKVFFIYPGTVERQPSLSDFAGTVLGSNPNTHKNFCCQFYSQNFYACWDSNPWPTVCRTVVAPHGSPRFRGLSTYLGNLGNLESHTPFSGTIVSVFLSIHLLRVQLQDRKGNWVTGESVVWHRRNVVGKNISLPTQSKFTGASMFLW